MRAVKTILFGTLLYLAMQGWMVFTEIVQVANEKLFLAIQLTFPWLMIGATLMLAVLAVIIPWDWFEEVL